MFFKSSQKGFSFVEIIISLFIVGLLSSLVIPQYLDTKSYLSLKTSSEELSEFFFLSQKTASSRGVTVNITFTYKETDPESIQHVSFFLLNPYNAGIHEDQVIISDFVQCSASTDITSIQFYPNNSWGLFTNDTPVTDSTFNLTLSFKDTNYFIHFFPNSATIQLIKPD